MVDPNDLLEAMGFNLLTDFLHPLFVELKTADFAVPSTFCSWLI
jgi:hypothetical protein